MSSTQESDVSFRDWLGSSKWKIALAVGLPIVGVGAVCIFLWSRQSTQHDDDTGDGHGGDGHGAPSEIELETENPVVLSPSELAHSNKLKGNEHFKAKQYLEAIECYTEAIGVCPEENKSDLAVYHQNRAAAHEQMEDYEKVIEDCSKALQLNKKYSKAYLRRAKAYEKLDKKQECLQDLTAVSMIEGMQNSSWMAHMDQILKAIGNEKAAEHFEHRNRILPSGVFIKAYLESFTQDVALVPDICDEEKTDTQPFDQAVKDVLAEKYENVLSLCTSEIEKTEPRPHLAKALCLRGTWYTLMSMNPEALKDFERLISLEDAPAKVKVNALIKRATICLQDTQNPQDSYNDFNEAIKLDPDNADIYHHRGQIHSLTDKLSEAKEDFERCVELDDSFVQAKVQLAFCVFKTAMMQQSAILLQGAKRMFNDIMAKHPDSGDAYSLFAQLNQEMQDFEAAEANFNSAISVEPKNPVHYVYKALLICQWKCDIDMAISLLKQAVELDPKCDFAYETLATLQIQSGDFEDAIKNFDKSLELVRSESEMARTFSIRQAAFAQEYVTKEIGLTPPRLF